MNSKHYKALFLACFLCMLGLTAGSHDAFGEEGISPEELVRVKKFEKQRIKTINTVIGSVIAIYGEERQGGGSGVIIDPSGIGLTNHHVIMGAGVSGWGGLADGKMYRWDLIGTDPGGDVAIIQLKGKDQFPFTPLADSDLVQAGDWALAMGNPFVLTEDQVPTVTLGIVSGVKRFQHGAEQNQLVYGNCIQTDSSINPGNSGGPLFNMDGRVIGINGRGSFKERGRVNVGLGYAISSNQIKNFIPDLLATKLVEHGTLDANFEDRDGKVVCSTLYEDSKLYELGVRPGDELLEFEGEALKTANQFTNLICTLPEDWPASLVLKDKKGQKKNVCLRLYGLPYRKPDRPQVAGNEKDQTPEQKEQIRRFNAMFELLSAQPGTIRLNDINKKYAKQVIQKWRSTPVANVDEPTEANEHRVWTIRDRILESGNDVGSLTTMIASNGTFQVEKTVGDQNVRYHFDGKALHKLNDGEQKELSLVDFKICLPAIQAMAMSAANQLLDVDFFGDIFLDGSDKATSRNAYRFKCVDSDEDSLFFWLSMEDDQSNELVELLKVGGSMDCNQDDGGVTFSSWGVEKGLNIAQHREAVVGLTEKTTRQFVFDSMNVETVDSDSLWKNWKTTIEVDTATGEE